MEGAREFPTAVGVGVGLVVVVLDTVTWKRTGDGAFGATSTTSSDTTTTTNPRRVMLIIIIVITTRRIFPNGRFRRRGIFQT